MRVLVIGGAGFIGTNAASSFAKNGAEVTVLDNFSREGVQRNADWLSRSYPGIKIEHADVRTDHSALRAHISGADLILHQAAQVAVTTSVASPRLDFENNALGTLNVLEALRSANEGQVLIYSSTNKVYGALEDLQVVERNGRYEFEGMPGGVTEAQNLDFHSPYGCSKGAADQYVHDYARIYGLRTIVFRQSCIYGPHQFGGEDQGWVAWFSIRAALRRPVTIYGDGKQVRDVLYVDDLVEAYRLAYENIESTSGKIYNLGGGPQNTLSLLELVRLLEERYGRKLDVAFSNWRPGDQRVFVSGIGSAKAAFGWEPRTRPRAGINVLCDWIDGNKDGFRG